ncbi:MAG: nicotinate-nucleotide diphosphorylase (carboxylating) [Halobacteriovoraceae bacterium]|nr:nicotinate-nucleotide diphosphorylase (carboxylating) [Halobacteriovoraceae bacterium]
MNLVKISNSFYEHLFKEDGVEDNNYYFQSLPNDLVECRLKIKDDCVLSGLSYFFSAFSYFQFWNDEEFKNIFSENEGKRFYKKDEKVLRFKLPFNVALSAERIALNLLQHSSAITTETKKFSDLASKKGIKILDTRKTTPGLRSIEKYAVRIGGGYNHRFSQSDLWMIKDNHKSFFGGVEKAVSFFRNVGSLYKPIELEVHNLKELDEGRELGINIFMLDNFDTQDIKKAVTSKREGEIFEVSGGITENTLENFLIEGVDAISVGKITYGARPIDLSFKYNK